MGVSGLLRRWFGRPAAEFGVYRCPECHSTFEGADDACPECGGDVREVRRGGPSYWNPPH